MNFWHEIKQRLGITTINDRLASIDSILQANTVELGRLRKKVKRPSNTYAQIERQRSERRHPNRHH